MTFGNYIYTNKKQTDCEKAAVFYFKKIYILISITALTTWLKRDISCLLFFTSFAIFYNQNFNIYKRLFLDLINLPDTDGPESYRMFADLRNFFFQLVNQN